MSKKRDVGDLGMYRDFLDGNGREIFFQISETKASRSRRWVLRTRGSTFTEKFFRGMVMEFCYKVPVVMTFVTPTPHPLLTCGRGWLNANNCYTD
jgi:hypothetical protein